MTSATTLSKAIKAIKTELETLRRKKVEAIFRPLHRERRKLQARVEKIDHLIERALGKTVIEKAAVSIPTINGQGPRRRKRIRRGGEELKKIAGAVVEFVKSKGKAGVTPAEITAAFGKLLPSPPQFVKKYAGVQLKRKGHAKRPKYFHS